MGVWGVVVADGWASRGARYAARTIGNNQLPMESNPTCQTNIAALLKCLRGYVKHPLHSLGIPVGARVV